MNNPQLAFTHPEFVRRYELLVERCWARSWSIWISSSSRSYEQQTAWYRLFLAGQWPAPVANPDQRWGPSPWGWDARGSLHMIQHDGWSHALDLSWQGPYAYQLHALARTCGIRFPEPGEDWHAQWWGLDGIYPVEDDDMNLEQFADGIGARVATEGDHAGKVVVSLLETLDVATNEATYRDYTLADAIVLAHQEGKTYRLTH